MFGFYFIAVYLLVKFGVLTFIALIDKFTLSFAYHFATYIAVSSQYLSFLNIAMFLAF